MALVVSVSVCFTCLLSVRFPVCSGFSTPALHFWAIKYSLSAFVSPVSLVTLHQLVENPVAVTSQLALFSLYLLPCVKTYFVLSLAPVVPPSIAQPDRLFLLIFPGPFVWPQPPPEHHPHQGSSIIHTHLPESILDLVLEDFSL